MKIVILAAAGVALLAAFNSQAQPYYLAGNFQGWCNNCSVMIDNGPVGTNGAQGSHQWEYDITGKTPNSIDTGGMKVTDGTWNSTWPGQNMNMNYNGSGAATIYFYPGNFTDGWFPTANRVGYADPGTAWEVTGTLTTPQYGSDPNAQMGLEPGSVGVYTNTYVVVTPGTYQYKFRTSGTWNDLQAGTDVSDNPGTLSFTTTSSNQAVTFTLDLPNGRWSASVPPVYCQVQFSVDMTLVEQTDASFDPTSVTVNGDALAPNGWGGTACTNNPSAANTNVYTSPYFSIIVGTPVQYQFRYKSGGNTMYDALGGISGHNRTLTVPNVTSTNIPTVYWNDALPLDLLNMDTVVSFNVNMANAVGMTNGVVDEVFNPSTDAVYINGDFTGWLAWNPLSLASYQCTNNPVGSTVYTYTMTFPKGHTRSLTYKYAINGADDEAGFAQNHFRYIRSTNGVDNLPLDTFGTQYNEPKFGNLAIGPATGGFFPVTWLGYPGVHLQSRDSLTSGSWVDQLATDSQSSTNWPKGGGSQFFRLVQP